MGRFFRIFLVEPFVHFALKLFWEDKYFSLFFRKLPVIGMERRISNIYTSFNNLSEIHDTLHVVSAYLTFVSLSPDTKRPQAVPPVLPESEPEKRRYKAAEARRAHRLSLRK